jgi:hypothetical protein
MHMKLRVRRWLLGLVMLFVFAGVYTPPAKAEVVVSVRAGHRYHRRYYRRHYYHREHYHRSYHRDYR